MSAKITLRTVKAVRPDPSGAVRYLFDSDLKGFGLKVTAAGVKTYFAQGRVGKGRRAAKVRYIIGKHGTWTPDKARDEAQEVLRKMRKGRDPRDERDADKQAITVSELCDEYLRKAEDGEIRTRFGEPKRASTLAVDRGRIERHIKPLIGRKLVKNITQADIISFLAAVERGKTAAVIKTKKRGKAVVKGGPAAAVRAVRLLQGIFGYAIARRDRDDNPAVGIKLAKDKERDRVLDAEEYQRLGDALMTAEMRGMNPTALRAIKMLALTGARRGEITCLRWPEIDAKRRLITLQVTKTGTSTRPISRAAQRLIESLPKIDPIYVFPAAGGGKPFTGLPRIFRRIVQLAEVEQVTPHTLRHSFATYANALGLTEATTAALIGHARRRTSTARYTHQIDSVLATATDAVAGHIEAMMKGEAQQGAADVVVPLRSA